MVYDVFISYRNCGGDAMAFLLHQQLTTLGYKVFYDKASLRVGKFDTKLLQVIDNCKDVLVLLSPNSLDRCVDSNDWFRLEITHALATGKNIVPVMMNGFEWPEKLIPEMEDLKLYNGVNVTFDFFEGVIAKIEQNMKIHNKIEQSGSLSDNKRILFWGDFDVATQLKIIDKMNLTDEYDIELVEYPISLLSRDLSGISAIILLVTDCTKFTANIVSINRLNEHMVEYVRGGGKIIAAHDVIYRRTKNEKLQEAFGCKTTHFKPVDAVHYHKTELCKEDGYFDNLPDTFDLHDDEICWGKTAPDVDVLFANEEGLPLVFAREYGRGVCLFVNPGEYKETLPRSILKPEKNFVELLKGAIKFTYK